MTTAHRPEPDRQAVAGQPDTGEQVAVGGCALAGRRRWRQWGQLAKCEPTAAQVAGLEAVLEADPAASGYEGQCWTLARVADQAWQRFAVRCALGRGLPS